MAAIVGQVDRGVEADVDTVRPRVLPLAPGAQEIALAVENHHRVVAAIEGVDVVVSVDPDRGDLFERPAVGQFRPILYDAVLEIAAADLDRHVPVPLRPISNRTVSDPRPLGNCHGLGAPSGVGWISATQDGSLRQTAAQLSYAFVRSFVSR